MDDTRSRPPPGGPAGNGTFKICGCTLSTGEINQLIKELENRAIRYISLRKVVMSDVDFERLMAAIGATYLQFLSLGVNMLNMADKPHRVYQLADAVKRQTNLCALTLNDNNLGEEGFRVIHASVLDHPNITAVQFSGCHLTDVCMPLMCELLPGASRADRCAKALEHLNLSLNPSVTSLGWAQLAMGLSATRTVKELFLDYNSLGDYGASCIIVALACCNQLLYIDLECTGITDYVGPLLTRLFGDHLVENKVVVNLDKNPQLHETTIQFLTNAMPNTCNGSPCPTSTAGNNNKGGSGSPSTQSPLYPSKAGMMMKAMGPSANTGAPSPYRGGAMPHHLQGINMSNQNNYTPIMSACFEPDDDTTLKYKRRFAQSARANNDRTSTCHRKPSHPKLKVPERVVNTSDEETVTPALRSSYSPLRSRANSSKAQSYDEAYENYLRNPVVAPFKNVVNEKQRENSASHNNASERSSTKKRTSHRHERRSVVNECNNCAKVERRTAHLTRTPPSASSTPKKESTRYADDCRIVIAKRAGEEKPAEIPLGALVLDDGKYADLTFSNAPVTRSPRNQRSRQDEALNAFITHQRQKELSGGDNNKETEEFICRDMEANLEVDSADTVIHNSTYILRQASEETMAPLKPSMSTASVSSSKTSCTKSDNFATPIGAAEKDVHLDSTAVSSGFDSRENCKKQLFASLSR